MIICLYTNDMLNQSSSYVGCTCLFDCKSIGYFNRW